MWDKYWNTALLFQKWLLIIVKNSGSQLRTTELTFFSPRGHWQFWWNFWFRDLRLLATSVIDQRTHLMNYPTMHCDSLHNRIIWVQNDSHTGIRNLHVALQMSGPVSLEVGRQTPSFRDLLSCPVMLFYLRTLWVLPQKWALKIYGINWILYTSFSSTVFQREIP